MTIWVNGRLLPDETACVTASDRGFTLGDGVFETIRVIDGAATHLPMHLRRLRAGVDLLGIALALADDALEAAIGDVLRGNALRDAALRLTVSRGPGPRGVLPPVMARPTVVIGAGPLPAMTEPVRLVTCSVTRRNEMSPLCGIKSLNYLDNVLARKEAAERGADDAVLLNTRGRLAETSIANLFLLRDGVLLTPALRDGALGGVMRQRVIERCDAGEASFHPEELARANGVMLTSALGLRAVASVDGQALAESRELVQRVREQVGL